MAVESDRPGEVMPVPSPSEKEPAEGSREVVDRELDKAVESEKPRHDGRAGDT